MSLCQRNECDCCKTRAVYVLSNVCIGAVVIFSQNLYWITHQQCVPFQSSCCERDAHCGRETKLENIGLIKSPGLLCVCMGSIFSRVWYGSTGYGCQSCPWSAEQGKCFFSCLPVRAYCLLDREREKLWSCETGSAVPSRVSPLILHTQAESSIINHQSSIINLVLTHGIPPAFRDSVHIYRQTPSSQSRSYRVTQQRTDGVHFRESAGTGPVVLKVFHNGCCLFRHHL